jgi:hypothetical protein
LVAIASQWSHSNNNAFSVLHFWEFRQIKQAPEKPGLFGKTKLIML